MRRGLRVPVAWRGAPGPNFLCTRRYAGDIRPHVDFGPGLPPGRPADVKRPLSMYVVEPKGRQGSFRRFLRMARGEAPFLVGSLACVAIFSAATLAIPAGFGDLLDHASRGEMPWHTAWRLMWLVGIAGICNFGRLIFVGFAGERMVALLRERLFKAMIRQPAAFFDGQDNRTGALVQRITMDTSVAGACLTEGLNQGTKNLLQVAGSITIMLYYSTTLSAVIFCILPPAAMLAGEYGKLVRKMQSKKQDATANMGVVADERLSNVRIVKAFGRDQEELRYFNKRVRNVFGIARTMVLWNASYVAFLNVAGYLTLYCMIWAGAMLVSVDELTAGALFSFMLYTINCGMGITGVTNLITDLNKGYGASLRLFDIIDKAEKLDAQEGQLKKLKLAPCEGRFGFRDLSFAYPTRPDATVLQDFSLDLTPGQCTCVVAASGAGKSSLANLLLKLYEPSTGRVTLDGHDLQTIDTTWLRSIIGYVPQEPVLFGGTVVENIAYGVLHRNWDDKMDEWTRDSVIAAAKKANAHEFIMALPDGYETYVGEGGKSLSGGQKQRIAIARALVRSPQLLILDEATSALDSESEAVVQAAIEKLIDDARVEKQRSVLIFAHRLSMIRQADTVVVLKDGRVADKGSYEHVLQNPYFRHLVGVDSKGNPDPTKNDISAVLGRTPHHLEPDEAPPARKLKQTPVEESAVESSTPPS